MDTRLDHRFQLFFIGLLGFGQTLIMKQSKNEVSPIRERTLTRSVCGLLGALFIFGPVLSPIVHEHQRFELASASTELLFGVTSAYIGCVAIGIVFLYVACTGKSPLLSRDS